MRGELNGCRQRPHLEECATVYWFKRCKMHTFDWCFLSLIYFVHVSNCVEPAYCQLCSYGVLVSSNATEFLIWVYSILARYRTILIEHFKALGYFLYHKVQHPKYHIQSTDCSVPVFCVDLRTNSGYFFCHAQCAIRSGSLNIFKVNLCLKPLTIARFPNVFVVPGCRACDNELSVP